MSLEGENIDKEELGVDLDPLVGASKSQALLGNIEEREEIAEEDLVVFESHSDQDEEEEDEELMFSRIDEKLSGAISPALGASSKLESGPILSTSPPQCPNCSETFSKSSELISHMSATHGYNESQLINMMVKLDRDTVNKATFFGPNGEKLFKCGVCDKVLKSVNSLNWHSLIHKKEKFFKCMFCEKHFRLPAGLTRHIQESHLKVKKFSCAECGSSFSNSTNLKEHQNIHSGNRPYQCKECGKAFKQKSSLFVHNRSHSTTFKFQCDVCKAGFRTKPVLEMHQRIHTNEKPFECPVCQRRFRLKHEMALHQSVHSEEKPFSCGKCPMKFRQRRYLLRHTKKYHPGQ